VHCETLEKHGEALSPARPSHHHPHARQPQTGAAAARPGSGAVPGAFSLSSRAQGLCGSRRAARGSPRSAHRCRPLPCPGTAPVHPQRQPPALRTCGEKARSFGAVIKAAGQGAPSAGLQMTPRRMGCHPEGPGQAREVGPCEPQEVQQGQVQGPAPRLEQPPA